MFSQALLTTRSRARSLWCAAVVGLLATSIAAGSAQASSVPAGDAVIASASGTTVDTTSGPAVAPATPASRAPSGSGRNALTLNSADPTLATTPSGSQVSDPSLEAPIVGSPGHRQADPATRAALAQIQSAGPIVAASGTAVATGRVTHRSMRPAYSSASGSSASASVTALQHGFSAAAPNPVATTFEINASGVDFFISRTSARRPAAPGGRSAPLNTAVIRPVGTSGSGFAGFLPTDPRPAPSPGGPANTSLYGSASGSSSGSALLGIDALLTIAVLVVGAAWRRRAWDLPVLPNQSALLALALDRPG